MTTKNITYSQHNINKSDIKNVVSTLKSGWLTQGSKVPEFEKILSNYVKSKYAIAVNSATSALHLSCLALGLRKMIKFGHHQIHLFLLQMLPYSLGQK